MLHFNRLSPAETERLALLSKELGEAQQAIGKILRHGYESRHPDGGPTNRETLERELGDVQFAMGFLSAEGDVKPLKIQKYAQTKALSVIKYLHHQEN